MRRSHVSQAGKWPQGTVPTPRMLRDLDQAASEMINAEDGGSWNPAEPIAVGPSTTPQIELTSAGSVESGDIETKKGNGAIAGLMFTGGSAPIYPTFQSGRSHTIFMPFSSWLETRPGTPLSYRQFKLHPTLLAPQSNPGTSGVLRVLSVPLLGRARRFGARLASIEFKIIVTRPRVALPASFMPKFRVTRIIASSGLTQNLHTTAGGYDANGWLNDPSATAADYYNGGAQRSVVYTTNQNNILDPSQYEYHLEVADEDEAEYGNVFPGALVTLDQITEFRPR